MKTTITLNYLTETNVKFGDNETYNGNLLKSLMTRRICTKSFVTGLVLSQYPWCFCYIKLYHICIKSLLISIQASHKVRNVFNQEVFVKLKKLE